jgi:hypothetical protein
MSREREREGAARAGSRDRRTGGPPRAPALSNRTAQHLLGGGAGGTLEPEVRARMESRFGVPLGDVRVHRGAEAARATDALHARAFTLGRDIAFAPGEYAPRHAAGERLLAHELTHAVQQRALPAPPARAAPPLAPRDHPSERAAEAVSHRVAAGAPAGPVGPAGLAAQTIARQEKPGEKPAEPEMKAGLDKPLWWWPVFDTLVLKLPERWGKALATAKKDEHVLFAPELGKELVYNQIMAGFNILHAGAFTGLSKYKPDFSKGLEMAEGLSGVSDTWLNLASLALRLDLKKYLAGDELKGAAYDSLFWAIMYGVALQGGAVAVNVLSETDVDFTSILKLPLKSLTTPPRYLGRPGLLGNIPDPRWSSYPFAATPSGLGVKLSGAYDPAKPYSLSASAGLNVGEAAGWYPKGDAEKAKYNGPELYPYLSYTHTWRKTPEAPLDPNAPVPAGSLVPPVSHQLLGGVFFGNKGVYGLAEGGFKVGESGTADEYYGRAGLVGRDLGPLSFQTTLEGSARPATSAFRERANASGTVKFVDTPHWSLSATGGAGYLLPSGTLPGAWDASGALSFAHKFTPEGGLEQRTGFDLGTTWRNQDPFDAASPRLFSLKGSVSVLDFFRAAVEYHSITGENLDLALPQDDVRFMIYPGKGFLNPTF